MCLSLIIKGWTKNEVNPIKYCGIWISIEGSCIQILHSTCAVFMQGKKVFGSCYSALQVGCPCAKLKWH